MITPCSLCNADCCKNLYITVTIFDVIRICERTGKKPEEFAVFYPLKLLNYDNDTVLEFYDGKTGSINKAAQRAEHILCIRSHPCLFLKGKHCAIHAFAPYVCKAFPKRIGSGFSNFCPFSAGILFKATGTSMPKDYAHELAIYKKIVAEWNRKKGKERDCMRFLIKQVSRGVWAVS